MRRSIARRADATRHTCRFAAVTARGMLALCLSSALSLISVSPALAQEPPDKPTRIFVEQGSGSSREEFRVCDQYTIQGDLFSLAVLGKGHTPTPLENSLGNMQVIEARLAEPS